MLDRKSTKSSERSHNEVPQTYVFRRRSKPAEPDVASTGALRNYVRRNQFSLDRSSSACRTSILEAPPKTYQYKRLLLDGHDDDSHSDSKQAASRSGNQTDTRQQEMKRDDEDKPVRFEDVPRSYRMSTSYRREDAAGTHRRISDFTPEYIEKARTHTVIKEACGCWFSLYNGYCEGHELLAKPYFNKDPYSGRLTEWTQNQDRNTSGDPFRNPGILLGTQNSQNHRTCRDRESYRELPESWYPQYSSSQSQGNEYMGRRERESFETNSSVDSRDVTFNDSHLSERRLNLSTFDNPTPARNSHNQIEYYDNHCYDDN